MSMNIQEEISKLLAEGYSQDEAATIVIKALEKIADNKPSQALGYSPDIPKASTMYNRAAEYFSAEARSQRPTNVFIPPHLIEADRMETERMKRYKAQREAAKAGQKPNALDMMKAIRNGTFDK